MLLSSVIIILREVLEAALLLSILIALSRQLGFNLKWIGWSLLFGLVGSILYGINTDIVSEWFEGVGQEVVNALMQIIIYFLLVFYLAIVTQFLHQQKMSNALLAFLMIVISTLAITREGSEIILYFFSVSRNDNHFLVVLIGMTIGASIGVSIGLLFYYLLINLKKQWSFVLGMGLLILVAAAMVSQATLLLIQADWLPAQLPLWDTSEWLSERSALGQLLYALIGYEATPTALQFSLYLSGFIIPIILIIGLKIKFNRQKNN